MSTPIRAIITTVVKRLLICALAAAALFAGCGDKSPSAESVAEDFVAAMANHDGKRACGYLTDSAKSDIKIEGVAGCVGLLSDPGPALDVGSKVEVVNVSGDRARAETDTAVFKLRKEGGEWKVQF